MEGMAAAIQHYFYPRSPCGERQYQAIKTKARKEFLSTFPLRGTSKLVLMFLRGIKNFYPRSPCGERPQIDAAIGAVKNISIHVPLAGNVCNRVCAPCHGSGISIHVPLAGNVIAALENERRPTHISIHVPLAGNVATAPPAESVPSAFLSTFPLRGTSGSCATICGMAFNFYPRSPCGERPLSEEHSASLTLFLSTFPLRRTSGADIGTAISRALFLSTFPLRGTSDGDCQPLYAGGISIHVPLAGNVSLHFSIIVPLTEFLSTFPLRGTSKSPGRRRGKR